LPISISKEAVHHQFYSSVLEKITLSSSQKQNQQIPIISSVILMQQTRDHGRFCPTAQPPNFQEQRKEMQSRAGRENCLERKTMNYKGSNS
jgi:hypothetical protein